VSADPPIGLESGVVRVVPYDCRWPELYASEAERLFRELEVAGLPLVLEHTGSTAVRGLAAKPIIDILAGRSASTSREQLIESLQRAGYVYRGEQGIPGRDFFRRGDPRSYHLHLTEVGSDFWNDHRAFRDYLRKNSEAAADYAALKLDLARRFPRDREAYIAAKTDFVVGILRRALPSLP
jgi:GrpB-like predicted nucleotidyltransferase (UPF0157 family)